MAGIISTEELAGQLGGARLRLLDQRGSFAHYLEHHIPGAQFLHIETLRMSEGGIPCKMLAPAMLGAIFSRLGISRRTPVVLYATNPGDHLSAAFTGWNLAVTGHEHWQILDGHFSQWVREGRAVTQQYPSVRAAPYDVQFQDDLYADWRYIADRLGSPDMILVDSRTRSLYTGAAGPTMRRGHIPGAVLHNFLWDFSREGVYLPLEQIRRRYERQGVTPEKEVITYCITGREGASNWFMLKYLLGYPRVRLYQASLSEWAALPDLPMVTGEQPGEVPHRRQRAA